MSSLQTLFVDEVKDIYNGEKQILRALPKMVKAAGPQSSPSSRVSQSILMIPCEVVSAAEPGAVDRI